MFQPGEIIVGFDFYVFDGAAAATDFVGYVFIDEAMLRKGEVRIVSFDSMERGLIFVVGQAHENAIHAQGERGNILLDCGPDNCSRALLRKLICLCLGIIGNAVIVKCNGMTGANGVLILMGSRFEREKFDVLLFDGLIFVGIIFQEHDPIVRIKRPAIAWTVEIRPMHLEQQAFLGDTHNFVMDGNLLFDAQTDPFFERPLSLLTLSIGELHPIIDWSKVVIAIANFAIGVEWIGFGRVEIGGAGDGKTAEETNEEKRESYRLRL